MSPSRSFPPKSTRIAGSTRTTSTRAGIAEIYRENADNLADRYSIPSDVLCGVVANIVGLRTVHGKRYLKAAGDPDNDFAEISKRLGYANMVRGTTVFDKHPTLEIRLARDGQSVHSRWSVVEHSSCDPQRPDRGISMRDDFADSATRSRHIRLSSWSTSAPLA
jgi:hypothetical protein